ncbi:Serine hydrolase-like protein [Alteripontixanthobacter maritimus]|uniref:Serine hydrolase-like protein n=1 Tax=Alteripontixanthobacter maritimus TaxID=2161824 RepID=A0A369Q698_9SPHN|nr:alpha/beta hydrolase [Alteripontixanthobacter maritimus]RDC60403.1 Serine hydrolase-like protein [Alteripontixanthobacter maritimus]
MHYRDYPAGEVADSDAAAPPILCLHGLTRNGRDFAALAQALPHSHRVLIPDMRGRGRSDHSKDTADYTLPTYVRDVEALLQQLGIDRFIAIGTSMGGLMTMVLALKGAKLAGAVLNDIGPDIDPAGIDHIRTYVGQNRSFPTWMHAARALKESGKDAFPDFTIEDWLAMAKRGLAMGQNGRIAFDYDMGIAEPFNQPDAGGAQDLWPAFKALSGVPTLLLRGALSNLLTAETAARMQSAHDDLEIVTVPRVGHAPTLDEPAARQAIAKFLERLV